MDLSAATTTKPPGNNPGKPMAGARAEDQAWENGGHLYCSMCFQPISSRPSGNSDNARHDAPSWLTSCGHITYAVHIFASGGQD